MSVRFPYRLKVWPPWSTMTRLPKPVKASAKATVPSWTACDRRAFGGGDVDAVADGRAARRHRRTAAGRVPGDRPVQVAAERAERQRRPRPAAVGNPASAACSFCCAASSSPASCAFRSRRWSISRISALRAATARSVGRARARSACACRRGQLRLPLCRASARDAFSSSSVAGARRRARDPARPAPTTMRDGLAELPHVGRREQQPHVAAAAQLVELHEARAQVRAVGRAACSLERAQSAGRARRAPSRPCAASASRLPQFLAL